MVVSSGLAQYPPVWEEWSAKIDILHRSLLCRISVQGSVGPGSPAPDLYFRGTEGGSNDR
jgi:hypothetical protein